MSRSGNFTSATIRCLWITATALGLAWAPRVVRAAEIVSPEATARGSANASGSANAGAMTVAVLDFSASDASNPNVGADIAAVVSARLANEVGLTMVDREILAKALREHELSLTALAPQEKEIKIGKFVGAKILVAGRAFRLGKELFITAKIVGADTSLLEGVMVKNSGDMASLVLQLADSVADKIHKSGMKITASPLEIDPLPELKKSLLGRRKPTVAVVIVERHQPLAAARPAASDPAAETEIKRLLIECGFDLVEVSREDRASFGKTWNAGDPPHWPTDLAKVEVLIGGEGMSELSTRIGKIVFCASRIEVSAVERQGGKLLFSEAVNARAVDLSEAISAKKSLQSGGRSQAIRILEKFDARLPRAAETGKEEQKTGGTGK